MDIRYVVDLTITHIRGGEEGEGDNNNHADVDENENEWQEDMKSMPRHVKFGLRLQLNAIP
jgi:hypothetical protein